MVWNVVAILSWAITGGASLGQAVVGFLSSSYVMSFLFFSISFAAFAAAYYFSVRLKSIR